MKEVLQPLNEKAADIIVRHADLLQSAQMEPLLLQLVAHVSAYRVILKRYAASMSSLADDTKSSVHWPVSGIESFWQSFASLRGTKYETIWWHEVIACVVSGALSVPRYQGKGFLALSVKNLLEHAHFDEGQVQDLKALQLQL